MEKQILIVDDDLVIRCAVSCILKEAGFKTSQVHDGQQALELILDRQERDDPFDLLLTDYGMPRMSGMALIHELAHRNINLPVIVFVTAMQKESVKGFGNGSRSQILEKPFEARELLRKVGNALDGFWKDAVRIEEASEEMCA